MGQDGHGFEDSAELEVQSAEFSSRNSELPNQQSPLEIWVQKCQRNGCQGNNLQKTILISLTNIRLTIPAELHLSHGLQRKEVGGHFQSLRSVRSFAADVSRLVLSGLIRFYPW